MRVTEQIDALDAMAINPVRYLVVPRVVAALVMLPVLTIMANTIAIIIGGWIVCLTTLDVSTHTYVTSMKTFFFMKDMVGPHQGVLLRRHHRVDGLLLRLPHRRRRGRRRHRDDARGRVVLRARPDRDYVLANVLFRFIFTP